MSFTQVKRLHYWIFASNKSEIHFEILNWIKFRIHCPSLLYWYNEIHFEMKFWNTFSFLFIAKLQWNCFWVAHTYAVCNVQFMLFTKFHLSHTWCVCVHVFWGGAIVCTIAPFSTLARTQWKWAEKDSKTFN